MSLDVGVYIELEFESRFSEIQSFRYRTIWRSCKCRNRIYNIIRLTVEVNLYKKKTHKIKFHIIFQISNVIIPNKYLSDNNKPHIGTAFIN